MHEWDVKAGGAAMSLTRHSILKKPRELKSQNVSAIIRLCIAKSPLIVCCSNITGIFVSRTYQSIQTVSKLAVMMYHAIKCEFHYVTFHHTPDRSKMSAWCSFVLSKSDHHFYTPERFEELKYYW